MQYVIRSDRDVPGGYRLACDACQGVPAGCHECGGVGYFDRYVVPSSCTREAPQCPIYSDPMCGGWECRRCGQSGPL